MNVLGRIAAKLLGSGIRDMIRAEMRGGTEFWMREGQPPDVSYDALVKNFTGYVYACASISASTLANTPLRLYVARGTGQSRVRNFPTAPVDKDRLYYIKSVSGAKDLAIVKGAYDVEEVLVHPGLTLLRHVNPQNNGFETMELTDICQELTGNAYWYLAPGPLDRPAGIWVLRPQWTKIIPDKNNIIKGYVFGRRPDQLVRFAADEVIHFKLPNPLDPWYGMGPVQAGAMAIARQKGMDTYEDATLRNMGRPDIMLTPKGGQLTPKARREFQRQWDSAYGGPDKAGKVYVANQDVELKDFGFSPREMAFLQGRTWTRTEICAMFPVPVGIFDVKDISKAPKAALDGTADFMARYNTRPRAIRMEQKLNEQLAPRYDDRLFFAFDDPVSDDREGRLKEIETMLTNYVQTVNEIRQDEGLPPVPWGDTPLVSMNTISLGSSPNANTGEPTKNALKALPADPNDCPANLIIKADGTVDRERTGGPNRALTQEEQEIAAIVNDVFVRQAADVDQNVAKAASDELPLFDAQKWTRELGALLFPLLIPAYQRGATNGLVQARVTAEDWDRIHPKAYRDTGVTKALNLSDWVESPEVIEAMKNRAFTVASVVNAKTLQKLQDQLVIGMQEGESIAAIQKRLRSTYKKWDRVRAARVARTEVIHAYNDGKIAAWSESEVVEGKEWNASGDACPFCLEMNGKVLPLNGAYHELGSEMNAEYQGQQIRMAFNFEQINGPPLHPNCRCALIPVVE